VRLSLEQGRVIGCLIEKQLTTPQQYPLTLNALVLACNQTSNRDPVVSYEEGAVQRVLASLKELGLVRFVYPSSGRSATRYRQVIGDAVGLEAGGLSLLAVLLLRGPQTAGELRTRTERMAGLDGLGAVNAALADMAAGSEPLVLQLPRRPGQKEERWVQLLTPDKPVDETLDPTAPFAPERSLLSEAPDAEKAMVGRESATARYGSETATLRDDVAALRAEVGELRALVEQLQAGYRPD
jgi:uncharacterized protein YceH (UPF0502 family)